MKFGYAICFLLCRNPGYAMNSLANGSSTFRPRAAAFSVSNARRWTVVWLLFAASLLNYLDRSTISFALPLISRDMNLGPETKGLLLSSFFWSYSLMQVPIGWCTDRFNLYWLYAAAFALWCVAQGLTGLAGSLAVLIIFRILLGIGEAVYLPGTTKTVCVLFERSERGLPSGISSCGVRMGLVLGGVLIPWLLLRFGWRQAFMLIGFGALLWLVPWLTAFPSRLHASYDANRRRSSSVMGYLQTVFANRSLLGICLGFFCFDYYWYVLVTWLPDYLVTVRHLSLLHAGYVASAGFLVFGTTEALGGWIADQLVDRGFDESRTRKGMVTFAFLCGLFLIAAIRVSDTRVAICMLMGACVVGLAPSNIMVILQCCAPQEHVGVWTGMENFAGNLGGVIAPLAIGFLIKWTGSYVPGFALGSIVLFAGISAYWLFVGELKAIGR